MDLEQYSKPAVYVALAAPVIYLVLDLQISKYIICGICAVGGYMFYKYYANMQQEVRPVRSYGPQITESVEDWMFDENHIPRKVYMPPTPPRR